MKHLMIRIVKFLTGMILTFFVAQAFADGASAPTDFQSLVTNVQTDVLKPLMQVVVALSYVSGVGFCVGGIFKLKAHKDNPQQVPIGTALFLLGVGIALLFVPTLIELAGKSIGFTSGGSISWSGSSVTG